jgi:hypothetical protein
MELLSSFASETTYPHTLQACICSEMKTHRRRRRRHTKEIIDSETTFRLESLQKSVLQQSTNAP